MDQNKLVKYFWVFSVGLIGFVVLLFLAIGLEVLGPLPSFEVLENPKSSLASEIISSDKEVLGKYFVQNRSYVDYQEISPNLINALIATEDVRFNQHSGIDLRGTLRAFTFLGKRGGASTITQQLAKNLFPRTRFNNFFSKLTTKLKEWVTAVKIEKSYTKQEIITLYLNTVDFGSNSFGIKSASQTFFSSTPAELTVEQASVLIGLLKATSLYSPKLNPENSLKRRNVVMNQMVKYEYLTKVQFDSLSVLPLELDYNPTTHNKGSAQYFREYLRIELGQWCEKNKKPDGTKYDLYRDGLKIYTTINSKMQQYAEESVKYNLTELQKVFFDHWKNREPWGEFTEVIDQSVRRSERYRLLKADGKTKAEIAKSFNTPIPMKIFSWGGDIDTILSPLDSIKYMKHFLLAGFMAMDPKTGYIKAWVGGPDFSYFKYDHVKTGKRQVGSTFKPFIYTVAIDNGVAEPCMKVPNQPVTFEDFDNWTPQNSDHKDGGMLTLKEGLAKSVNHITAYLMKEITPKPVVDMAKRMGITSHMDPYPSICLGTPDVSVFDMVGAYSTFANKGVWTKPTYLLRIEDKNGNVLQEFNPERRDAMSEQTAYIMLKMLQEVVNRGTGVRLRGPTYKNYNPVAGKTGTTQNNSDGWFMGITPDLVAGAWVGCEDRSVHFRTTRLGGGNNTALPIWGTFFNSLYADSTMNISTKDFDPPAGGIGVNFDCSSSGDAPFDDVFQEIIEF
ncbi:MAG: penicillin-binding protein 1A [Sphingobacteriales bacterium]|jgi:penicillin-binding protein 1A